MGRILVNALSVTNQSGLHVLAGHLNELLGAGILLVVIARKEDQVRNRLGDRVEWVAAPDNTVHWFARVLWERRNLQKVATRTSATVYFTPSGITAANLNVKQVVLCQNPWCLVPSARRKQDALKAWLQRRAYRQTMLRAEVMVFNSEYMKKAYRENAGFDEKKGVVVYQAADEETRRRAEEWRGRSRIPGQIVCVSVMAPHKNVEAVVQAVSRLPKETTLRLVGSWPDASYEQKIRDMINELGISDRIFFDGFVSREELDRFYAESQVYCLLSRCESFGIPAMEAQLFGTPVVCSDACAVPEVCGDGGLFCDPDDVEGVAEALNLILSDSDSWNLYSKQAVRNADRFRWKTCSQPLTDIFRGL